MLHRTKKTRGMDTCLQGYIDVSYDELVDAFGLPEPAGDKTTASWTLSDSGCVVTIYDYKSRIAKEDNRDWHIGGKGPLAVRLIRETFLKHKVTDAR